MKCVKAYFELKKQTDKAVLLTDGENNLWLPLSQITIRHLPGDNAEISIPVWLAKKKGII